MYKKFKNKIGTLLVKLYQLVRSTFFIIISNCDNIIGKPIQHQPIQYIGKGVIQFYPNVNIGVYQSPFYINGYCYFEARNSNAKIIVGSGTWINNNFTIICEHTSISIGANVLIGTCVEIYDSDFHGIKPEERLTSSPIHAKKVVIEDNVFIGSNVTILKGVTVGKNSIIANSAVVTSDVPSNSIAAGIPAKVIKQL